MFSSMLITTWWKASSSSPSNQNPCNQHAGNRQRHRLNKRLYRYMRIKNHSARCPAGFGDAGWIRAQELESSVLDEGVAQRKQPHVGGVEITATGLGLRN